MKRNICRLSAIVLCLALTSCALKHPELTPQARRLIIANEAVVALGSVQHAAIELNKVNVCDPQPCHPLFSDQNTGVVVDIAVPALLVLKRTPDGAPALVAEALRQIRLKLDAAGKQRIAAYLNAAETIVKELR